MKCIIHSQNQFTVTERSSRHFKIKQDNINIVLGYAVDYGGKFYRRNGAQNSFISFSFDKI